MERQGEEEYEKNKCKKLRKLYRPKKGKYLQPKR